MGGADSGGDETCLDSPFGAGYSIRVSRCGGTYPQTVKPQRSVRRSRQGGESAIAAEVTP